MRQLVHLMILNSNKERDFMDNIIIEKVWQDANIIELKITANSEYVTACQSCYVEDVLLEVIADKISKYVKDYNNSCYLEFGNKEGDYTPAFSMNILTADSSGHVKIEVDLEIADNEKREHRCCFYVESELGQVERLGQSLKSIISSDEGAAISLL